MENNKELVEALRNHQREQVRQLLQQGGLKQIGEEETAEVYLGIVALRDMELVDLLVKDAGRLSPEMLQLEFDNLKNREFIIEVLKKYRNQFDLNDEAVCDAVMELACDANDKSTASFLIKQGKASAKYPKLAGAVDEVFQLLVQLDKTKIDADIQVGILYETAKSVKAEERLLKLAQAGYDLKLKNEKGQTVSDLLKADIGSGRYAKNKRGELNRTRDKATLQYIEKILNNPEMLKGRKMSGKQKIIAGVGCLVVLGAIAFAIGHNTASDAVDELGTEYALEDFNSELIASGTESADENWYVTDPDRVIAEGDNVNIDYIGYVDGVAFDGGNTNGMGTDLLIGSQMYIDDFEEQLIGHKAGDEVIVTVTFPENYGSEDLKGKEAEFHVTINGIYAE